MESYAAESRTLANLRDTLLPKLMSGEIDVSGLQIDQHQSGRVRNAVLKIADILSNHIVPFETEDMKLKSLFNFFLHLAPTISSSSAGDIPKAGLARTLASFLRETRIQNDSFRFYTSGSINKKQLERYSLSSSSTVSRKSKCFICSRKSADECK